MKVSALHLNKFRGKSKCRNRVCSSFVDLYLTRMQDCVNTEQNKKTFNGHGGYTDILPRRRRPAFFDWLPCYRLQFLLVHFVLEKLPHEVRTCQLPRSRLQHHSTPDILDGVEVSVHELHAF